MGTNAWTNTEVTTTSTIIETEVPTSPATSQQEHSTIGVFSTESHEIDFSDFNFTQEFPPLANDGRSLQVPTNSTQSEAFRLGITILYVCAEALICIFILIGNSLVLRAIHTERKLQTFTNYFVASLAIADLLVGGVGIPTSLVAFFGYPRKFIGCLFVNTLIIMLTQISIFGLVVISIERYVAIRYPFFYQEHSRKRNAIIVIVISWLAAILVGMVPIMGWNLRDTYDGEYCNFIDIVSMVYMVYFNFFGFVLTPLILMFCLYCYIYKIVRKQTNMIAKQQISLGHQGTSPEHSDMYTEDPNLYTHSSTHCITLADSYSQEHPDVQHEVKRTKTKHVYSISNPNLLSVPNECELVSIRRHSSATVPQLQVLKSPDVRLTPRLVKRLQNGHHLAHSPKPARAHQNGNGHTGSSGQGHARQVSAMKKLVRRFQQDLRAAKWFAIVIAVFALCWLPLHIMNTISLLATQVPTPFVVFAIVLSHANSAVNPVLYAYTNTKFKAVMLRLVCCGRFSKKRSSPYTQRSTRNGNARNRNENGEQNGANGTRAGYL